MEEFNIALYKYIPRAEGKECKIDVEIACDGSVGVTVCNSHESKDLFSMAFPDWKTAHRFFHGIHEFICTTAHAKASIGDSL